ncbi:CHAT domain-containing protein [Plantactinospora sp. CA-294935]|uniref:CHAT domain-containing protein n=1 Tax=Plantactinospora sp. CA-294935 TaxID=3240012 RepID=UPI003D8B9613
MINTPGTDERIGRLRAALSGVSGTARIGPLLELGRAYADRYGRATQHNLPSAATDLDDSVTALREAYGLLAERDPWRPQVATVLARLLGMRFVGGGRPDTDRDEAIDLFVESMAHPDLPAADLEVGRYFCGTLLQLRAMPQAGMLDGARTVDISDAFAMVTAMQRGDKESRRRDLDLAASLFRQLVDAPPVQPQIHRMGALMLSQIDLIRSLSGLGGPAASFDLDGMMRTLRQAMDVGGPGAPGHDQLAAMQVGMFTQRFGDPAEPGSLGNTMQQLIEQHSGVRMMLPALVQELARLTGEGGDPGSAEHLSRMSRLRELGGDGSLPDATAVLLVDATLAALAYRPAEPADRVVALAESVLSDAGAEPSGRGGEHLLATLALALRGHWVGRPDDLRRAAGHLRESVSGLTPGSPVAAAGLGLLGVLVDHRYALGGPAHARLHPGQLVELTGQVLAAQQHAAGADHRRLSVVRALRCLGQLAEAVRDGDRAGLGTAVDALHDALDAVPEAYPWRSRLSAGLALGHLVRAGADGPARAADLLAAAVPAVPGYHTDRPGLVALAGLAALPPARAGDPAAADRAVELLTGSLDVAGERLPVGRTVLLAALGSAHLTRAVSGAATSDLELAVRHLGQAREELADRPGNLTHPVLRELAVAYRRWAETGHGGHERATRTGLAALRAAAEALPTEPGAQRRLAVARAASAFGLTVADWCAADGWRDGLAEAVELARALTTLAATTAGEVPDRLAEAGQPDLAAEWRRAEPTPLLPAALCDLFDLAPPPALHQRVRDALGLAAPAVPTVPETAAALRDVGADLLAYLLPGRLVWVSAAGQVGTLSPPGLAVPPDGPVARFLAGTDPGPALPEVCDWAWPAVIGPLLDSLPEGTGADRPARLVLVPHGPLGRVPWHAARESTGPATHRYAGATLVLSYASSAGELVAASGRIPPPVTRDPVFLVNPLGHDGAAAYATLAVRRLLYPRSSGLGHTGDPADRPATPDGLCETLSRASAGPSMVHLACRAVLAAPPTGPWFELAGAEPGQPPEALPAGRLLRHPAGKPTGGLVTASLDGTDLLGEGYDIALTPATALIASGAAGVAGSGWTGGPAGHPALLAMVHHFLADRGMAPAEAVHAGYRWLLDPDRVPPPHLAPVLPGPVGEVGPAAWAGFRYQGR